MWRDRAPIQLPALLSGEREEVSPGGQGSCDLKRQGCRSIHPAGSECRDCSFRGSGTMAMLDSGLMRALSLVDLLVYQLSIARTMVFPCAVVQLWATP